jgi:hypothetical protein
MRTPLSELTTLLAVWGRAGHLKAGTGNKRALKISTRHTKNAAK